jgi:hypothetical protein
VRYQPWVTAALAAVALVAVFAIGILVGREIARPASPVAATADAAAVAAAGGDGAPFPGPAVPAELLAYRLLVEVPVPLDEPTGIASAADGTVFACGDRSLLALDRSGALKRRWDFEDRPTCVAAADDGTLYVGFVDHVEVVKLGGSATRWTGLGGQAIVTSIAVLGREVLVADAGNRMVLRFDPAGRLVGTLGGGWVVPSPYFDVAAAPDGTAWVADPGRRTLRHFAADGTLLAAWGESSPEIAGFGGCCNPVHLAVLPCGAPVTAEKGLPRVKVYEPDGRLWMVTAGPSKFAPSETGLDLATRKANGGEVIVLVPSRRVVRVYARKEGGGGG